MSKLQQTKFFVTVNHLVDLDRKISSSQFNLDQLNVGKQAFLSMLRESLAKVEVVQ